ncbi:MAG: hypothetical protein CR963_01390, partial [Gammaproteobacteria bacterium]
MMAARIENTPIDQLKQFDMAEELLDAKDIVEYLNIVMEEGDAGELAHALGVCARANEGVRMQIGSCLNV